jgi:hypothetical protein
MIEKTSPEHVHINEQESGHVLELHQRRMKRVSIKELIAQVLGVLKHEHDVIDIARFSKVTVRTEYGVYDANECEKAHTGDEKCDRPPTLLYSSGGHFEGYVCDIKGKISRET